MKTIPTTIAAIMMAMTMSACEVEKTQEGELPEVSAEGGQMPDYEVTQTQEGELPDVDVSGGEMPEYDVETPDVEVGTEQREVSVPTVDIQMPDDEQRVESEG